MMPIAAKTVTPNMNARPTTFFIVAPPLFRPSRCAASFHDPAFARPAKIGARGACTLEGAKCGSNCRFRIPDPPIRYTQAANTEQTLLLEQAGAISAGGIGLL